jgi:hypothetical protein
MGENASLRKMRARMVTGGGPGSSAMVPIVSSSGKIANTARDEQRDFITLGPAKLRTQKFNGAASPWLLGNFAGSKIGGIRIHMHGRIFYSGLVGILQLQPNGGIGNTMGTDWMAQRFYFSGGASGTDIQGNPFTTGWAGMFVSHVGWTNGPPTQSAYVNLWGVLHTNRDAGFVSWEGRYTNMAGENSNNRIEANVQSTWWNPAVDIESLSIFHNGTSPTFTGTITTEVIG